MRVVCLVHLFLLQFIRYTAHRTSVALLLLAHVKVELGFDCAQLQQTPLSIASWRLVSVQIREQLHRQKYSKWVMLLVPCTVRTPITTLTTRTLLQLRSWLVRTTIICCQLMRALSKCYMTLGPCHPRASPVGHEVVAIRSAAVPWLSILIPWSVLPPGPACAYREVPFRTRTAPRNTCPPHGLNHKRVFSDRMMCASFSEYGK